MCGLAGLWRPSAAPAQELEAHSRAMADAIAHRGPDDAGVRCNILATQQLLASLPESGVSLLLLSSHLAAERRGVAGSTLAAA